MLPLKQVPQSICILRLSAIGDATHIVPIIRTIQQYWPDCKISWIIGKAEAQLLADLENVEFIIIDKHSGWQELWQLRRRLRQQSFDILLHMQAALRASLIATFIKAPIKLGFDKSRAIDYQWLFTNTRIVAQSQQHVLDGFFGFIETLGLTQRVLDWNIPIPQEAKKYANALVNQHQKTLVINACSSNRRQNWRNWSAQHYASVIDYAVKQYNMQIVLTGGPDVIEHDMAVAIMQHSSHSIINQVGKTSLKQLLAIIQQASVVIAPDTGPAHIATACGVPVIGLFASSNPLRTGPYLSQQWVVNQYPQALAQYMNTTIAQVKWGQRIRHPEVMDLISVAQVTAQLDKILIINTTLLSSNCN